MSNQSKLSKFLSLITLFLLGSLLFKVPLIAAKKEKFLVLYAGALNYTNENLVGPAFEAKHDYQYLGEGHGSLPAARLIKEGLRYPDVFQSADAKVNESVLMGKENGNFVSWYFTFASSEMVIIYYAKSRFADQFSLVEKGEIKWYEVLAIPGLRFGRADPDLDPKGYRTLFVMELAQKYYHDLTIAERVLGNVDDSKQIFRESELLARLESGQIDATIGYKNEAIERNFPFISLPQAINLGSTQFVDFYGSVSYTSGEAITFQGSPILFTITVPRVARHRKAAVDFVSFILSREGQDIYAKAGLGKAKIVLGGDKTQVPLPLQKYIQGVLNEG